jgi:cytochrome c peroxidase
MLPVDVALVNDPLFRASVEMYADDEKAFYDDFAFAFGKVSHVCAGNKLVYL